MDSTSFCNQRSPSSDRLLGLFFFSPPSSASAGEELNEAEVFWTTDFTEPAIDAPNSCLSLNSCVSSRILAVLPEPGQSAQVPYRKLTISSSSKPIPSIPRLSSSQSQSQSVSNLRKLYSSAPMMVPVLSRTVEKHRRNDGLADVVDDEMLPPHKLVARGSGVSNMTTFLVLEYVGRTLKGRDLRQLRNAIWRKTGFLNWSIENFTEMSSIFW